MAKVPMMRPGFSLLMLDACAERAFRGRIERKRAYLPSDQLMLGAVLGWPHDAPEHFRRSGAGRAAVDYRRPRTRICSLHIKMREY